MVLLEALLMVRAQARLEGGELSHEVQHAALASAPRSAQAPKDTLKDRARIVWRQSHARPRGAAG